MKTKHNISNKKIKVKYITGQVIAVFGIHYLVESGDGPTLSCVMRGKKTGVACGDQVEILPTTLGQGVIENINPRSTLLYRSDAYKEKIIAANVTQIIFVVAAIPSFNEELINRCLIAAESQHIPVVIVLNKSDLPEPTRAASSKLSFYQELGYPLIIISAKQDINPLLPYLKNHLSVLAGQSGMGKSTLINKLIPEAKRATAEISTALNSGSHTTTNSHLYHLDATSHIIDSPGFQEFGLNHISDESLAWGFIEFHPFIGQCKFHNCRHKGEPGCALALAVQAGKVSVHRLALYRKLLLNRN